MSDFVLRTTPNRGDGLRSVLDWLRQARTAATLAAPSVASTEAAFLSDVGLSADQIERAIDRGNSEIGLLGLGWQQPGRSARR